MHLIVFDLDGTLLESVGVDNACFVAAVEEVWGLSDISTEWDTYSDATDQAIACDLYHLRYGAVPDHRQIDHLRTAFERRLTELLATQNAEIAIMPGAAALLAESRNSRNFRAAIATGSWSGAMFIKAAKAQLDLDGIPFATADDAARRAEIIGLAIARASEQNAVHDWESIIYIGDGVWDCRAAAELNLRFIGIARGEEAERLQRTGADLVLSDLRTLLEAAGVADDRDQGS